MAAAYASLAFANNTDRLLVYALPAVVPVALAALRSMAGAGRRWGAVAATALGLQVFFYLETPFHEQGISVYPPTGVAVVVALCVFWLGARVLSRVEARRA